MRDPEPKTRKTKQRFKPEKHFGCESLKPLESILMPVMRTHTPHLCSVGLGDKLKAEGCLCYNLCVGRNLKP